MNKVTVFLFATIATVLIFTQCKKEEQKYKISVKVSNPDGYKTTEAENVWVIIQNTNAESKDSAKTNSTGVAVFENVSGGVYNISAQIQLSKEQAEAMTGIAEKVQLQASENNVSIVADQTVDLKLKGARVGNLVFKEVYYSGSKTPAGKTYFSDQYYEIYNNSTDVIYADGLCLGVVSAWKYKPTISPFLKEYPNKTAIESFWYIPGSGKEHPIEPGKSIIIAQDGINHKSDPLGNPNSPVDLSDADWETYVPRDDNKDIDQPKVPNLELGFINYFAYDWLTSVFGTAYTIFKIDGDIEAYVEKNKVPRPGSSSKYRYILVDNDKIIDGFQAYKDDSETSMPKVHAVIDAGFTFDPDGTYSGKCVRRKVKAVYGGRTVYQDTNNSTEDFLSGQECKPREN